MSYDLRGNNEISIGKARIAPIFKDGPENIKSNYSQVPNKLGEGVRIIGGLEMVRHNNNGGLE